MEIPKIAEMKISSLFIAGVTKSVEERLLAPVIGNANVVSGLVKLGIAFGIPKLNKSEWVQSIALGFAVDGVEDLVTSFTGGQGVVGGVLGHLSGLTGKGGPLGGMSAI